MKNITHSRSILHGEQGMTLVEIVVVLIIIGIVMTVLGGKILGAGDSAKVDLTKIKMKDIKLSVDTFRLRYNSLPSSLDELTGCSEKTGGASCVPVIRDPQGIKDAWGNNFSYALENGGRTYRIKSTGADGRDGGSSVDADITDEGP